MLTLQLLTGCRPGEVRMLRKRMIKRTDNEWVLDFERSHKMAYRGKRRIVPIGPQALLLLQPWLAQCEADQHVFRPELAPKTNRRNLGPSYTSATYTTAVLRACAKAGVVPFGPNRVRHLAATEIRQQFGLEAAQAVLGHSHYSTTERYASLVPDLAKTVAKKRE
ncbi:tyrosine-type recombinase/integrase [Gemmata massiliana]|nr:site-specific integrase [Gemmata massiliana]